MFLHQRHPEYRQFRAKNCFTDHRTANTIHGFRDSVPALEIYDCYEDTHKFEQLSIPTEAIARREQCVDINNPLQTVFKHFKLYTLTQIVR